MKKSLKTLLCVIGFIVVAKITSFYLPPSGKWQEKTFEKGQLSVIDYLTNPENIGAPLYYLNEKGDSVYVPDASIIRSAASRAYNDLGLDSTKTN